jgi:hypothetical protein
VAATTSGIDPANVLRQAPSAVMAQADASLHECDGAIHICRDGDHGIDAA